MAATVSQKEMEAYEEFWQIADKNRDGRLTIQELQAAVKKYKPDVTDCEVAGMFCGVDLDEDKIITKREYMTVMTERMKRSKAIMALFKKYDKDGSNTLNRGEVIQMIKDCYPPDKTHFIVGEFLSYCDLDGSGQVTFDEFSAYFGETLLG